MKQTQEMKKEIEKIISSNIKILSEIETFVETYKNQPNIIFNDYDKIKKLDDENYIDTVTRKIASLYLRNIEIFLYIISKKSHNDKFNMLIPSYLLPENDLFEIINKHIFNYIKILKKIIIDIENIINDSFTVESSNSYLLHKCTEIYKETSFSDSKNNKIDIKKILQMNDRLISITKQISIYLKNTFKQGDMVIFYKKFKNNSNLIDIFHKAIINATIYLYHQFKKI